MARREEQIELNRSGSCAEVVRTMSSAPSCMARDGLIPARPLDPVILPVERDAGLVG
jgi:hypothetical protein